MPGENKPDYEVLFDRERLAMITRLPSRALPDFVRAMQDARIDRVTQAFLEDYMTVAISSEGKGREEAIDAIGASLQRRQMEADMFLDMPVDHDDPPVEGDGLGDKMKRGLRLGD